MTDDTLNKANEIKNEIRELEHFIHYAQLTWTHLSFLEKLRNRKAILHHKGYGAFSGGDYELSEELSEKIMDVLEQHLEKLREDYRELN